MHVKLIKTFAFGLVGLGLAAGPVLAQSSAVQRTPSQSEQSAGSNNAESATPSSPNPRGNATGTTQPRSPVRGPMDGSMKGQGGMHSQPQGSSMGPMDGTMKGHRGMRSSSGRSGASPDNSADALNAESLAASQSGKPYMPGMSHDMPASSGKKRM